MGPFLKIQYKTLVVPPQASMICLISEDTIQNTSCTTAAFNDMSDFRRYNTNTSCTTAGFNDMSDF